MQYPFASRPLGFLSNRGAFFIARFSPFVENFSACKVDIQPKLLRFCGANPSHRNADNKFPSPLTACKHHHRATEKRFRDRRSESKPPRSVYNDSPPSTTPPNPHFSVLQKTTHLAPPERRFSPFSPPFPQNNGRQAISPC